ncbi:hypothetical protein B0H66DRAFT_179184 [Apodospora peruviana]|uniref:Peptidase M43 pregnancy-associated plasma-A domain-containing protein n=1 Tax=Apodospora peruviana TaxID=516989 RepID=A0AAE0IAY4_9PEZI|nr:hypothetical protein B0H66DRAFT_179184 [Apodospora peruviana]
MFIQEFLLGLLAVSPVMAEKCDVHIDGVLLPQLEFDQLLTARADPPVPPTVDLYVHVVAGSTKRDDGYLSADEVVGQVQLIKDLYKPTGLTFNHNKDTMAKWYVNSSWAGEETGSAFNEMKMALHQGDYKTINLYIRNITDLRYGGTCTNPWRARTDVPDKARRLALDGCVIATFSLPGSNHAFMNQGKTAVHEIGHWWGLWHPWEDGGIRNGVNPPDPCWVGNPDDNVTDTPKMKNTGTGTCVETQDSCRGDAFTDPIHNYMAYSSDACLTEFTKGQVSRMYAIYDEFRKTGQPI